MDQILNKVQNVDPNNSEAVKECLSGFFQNLLKHKEHNSHRWLRELLSILNRFPKYCMSHRSNIETYLISFIDSNNIANVIEAAKCAHSLQQVRPTQEKTATPKSSWRDQMNLLCNAAHTLITAVFPNVVDIYKDTSKSDTPSPNSPLSDTLVNISKNMKNAKDKQGLLYTRLNNVLIFIQAMLVETYPVAKPIRPQLILDVIVRALSASGSEQNAEISSVKTLALRTLDALVVCLGSNLIPFSPLVFRLVLQTLRWSSENLNDDTSKARCTAYNSLNNWLTTLHVHRPSNDNKNAWEDELTKHIVNDITPTKKVVQLTMGAQPTKHLSKKAKRKLANSQLLESSIAAHMPGEKNKISVSEEVNNEVAMAALECAETFLIVCGRFLKPQTHKLFQERLVKECYNHSSYADNHLVYFLRVLEASRKTTPSAVPPPTQYCLHLYSVLINSKHNEISKFCSQALLDIRLHLHCSPPSLNFALDESQEKKKTLNKRKKISEKNRAVLESLLGTDKVPPASNDEEVITIPDEPANKKLRIENDDTDQISVSSDSVSSVEISDDSDEDNVQEVEVVVELNESTKENEVTTEANKEAFEEEVKNSTPVEKMDQDIVDSEANAIETEQSVETNKQLESPPIHEAPTQILLNASTDTIEEERPVSLEVGSDYPNTGTEKVTILEKMDDENLPCTDETDDIQITCGQVVINSQEVSNSIEKKSDENENKADEIPKVNGIDTEIVENGHVSDEGVVTSSVNENAKVAKDDGVSVEDMLADFVDEVNEEAIEA